MHNAVMCTLSLYDVIGTTSHLHIKLKSFSNIAQPLHKEAVRRCSFPFITAKKSVIMSEAFFVDVSLYFKKDNRRRLNGWVMQDGYFFRSSIFSARKIMADLDNYSSQELEN